MKIYNKLINTYYYAVAYSYKLLYKFKHLCSFPVSQGVDSKCKCGKSFRESI
jgi:hypothetical protein